MKTQAGVHRDETRLGDDEEGAARVKAGVMA